MIRVLICDDQMIARQGLQVILSTDPEIEIVDTASHGEEAIRRVEKHRPDLVMMDLKMPVMNGVQATVEIKRRFPETQVLVLTTYDADEWVLDAIRNGANGYLLKDTPSEQLIQAVHDTMSGKTHISPAVAGTVFSQVAQAPVQKVVKPETAFPELTERELKVLKLLTRGLSNREISKEIHLSEGTVRNYVSNILFKLDVQDRTKAAVMAIRHGLVDWE
jgi:DNA-binding NarL/FixJ family response regulator